VSTELAAAPARSFELDRAWSLHAQVSIRPERFGALLYHFDTRRLSFVKNPRLLAVLQTLAGSDTARDACDTAGVLDAELPIYTAALATLAASSMICRRPDPSTGART
jgi:putative mycofactocin binding protein MftB